MVEKKKTNIKNKLYRKFLDDGEIKIITPEEIKIVLDNIKGKNVNEARALVIVLYYTGARPNEVLRLKSSDISKEKNGLRIQLKGSKRGLPRPFYLPLSKPFAKELKAFWECNPPFKLLFPSFINRYERTVTYKSGKTITRLEISDKLRYHINRWFAVLPTGTITTYYLRHNRFSQLAGDGAEMGLLKMLKGSKTMESINPYLHLSTEKAKKIGRLLK